MIFRQKPNEDLLYELASRILSKQCVSHKVQ